MRRQARAANILDRLRDVPPQHANHETVAAYEKAAELLSGDVGSPAWFEAMIQLGSHLLESPDGDHGANVAKARGCYQLAMDIATERGDQATWLPAVSGYANALLTDPSAGSEALREAIELLDELEGKYSAISAVDPLAVTLGQEAAAYARLPDGDPHHNLDHAIELQERAVRLLAESGPELAARRGRARHNLAVLYSRRETGIRSQNVDRAVRSLQAALEDRSSDTDPVGRARTLRALAALYPEWMGTDSLDDARDLAEAAATEAGLLERDDPQARARTKGWAYFEREQSALNVDLDATLQTLRQDNERAAEWFNAMVANHQKALEVLPRESMPIKWAEWSAGLGRILGRAPALGDYGFVDQAHACFADALAAFDPADRPLLGRQIQARWGEYSHELGDFTRSLTAYRAALDLSDLVLVSTVDPGHRLSEISQSRGYGLFAGYAAARLGMTGDAAVLAERERMRLNAPLLKAQDVLRRPTAPREQIRSCLVRIRGLEQQLRALNEQDPEAKQEGIAARLADDLGMDVSMISVRRVDDDMDEQSPVAEARSLVLTGLAREHAQLQMLMPEEGAADTGHIVSVSDIAAVARERGVALVYLLGTVHGSMAVLVLPSGELEQVRFDEVDSDVTNALLNGDNTTIGFLEAAQSYDPNNPSTMVDCLNSIRGALTPLFDELTSALARHRVDGAMLIPLGRLGLLPVHVAAGDLAYSYAPSAGVLRSVASFAPRHSGMLVLADPGHYETESLPLSVAEARTIACLATQDDEVVTLVRSEATGEAVRRGSAAARVVHFGCHGEFRPSEPLASHLQLAAHDEVTVADIFSGDVELGGAGLVTLLACETAAGDSRRAPDEGLSFPAAVLVGGAAAVVSTMWPVADDAAALFSVKFYELTQHALVPPAKAVVAARAWMRSATSVEVLEVVDRMRASLTRADAEAAAALDDLASDLTDQSELHPFAGPDLWAPFILTGC